MRSPTMTSTELPATPQTRRLAAVVVGDGAASAAPPGIEPEAFAAACLADTYEVLADLVDVTAGVVGSTDQTAELLWPGSIRLDPGPGARALVGQIDHRFDEVVLVPSDVPDLPGLVVAKVFKALRRADVCLSPTRGGDGGLVALGLRLPWPSWITLELTLEHDPTAELVDLAPRRAAVAVGPDWHRLREPASVHRLDPGLEGWELTRSLLSGRALDLGAPP
jgi:hypothetical protein